MSLFTRLSRLTVIGVIKAERRFNPADVARAETLFFHWVVGDVNETIASNCLTICSPTVFYNRVTKSDIAERSNRWPIDRKITPLQAA